MATSKKPGKPAIPARGRPVGSGDPTARETLLDAAVGLIAERGRGRHPLRRCRATRRRHAGDGALLLPGSRTAARRGRRRTAGALHPAGVRCAVPRRRRGIDDRHHRASPVCRRRGDALDAADLDPRNRQRGWDAARSHAAPLPRRRGRRAGRNHRPRSAPRGHPRGHRSPAGLSVHHRSDHAAAGGALGLGPDSGIGAR